MAKKYLSVEEAAERLNMTVDQLNHLRERGEIRGFTDRGTWKFKYEDVDKLYRQKHADSDPDVQLLKGDSAGSDSDDDLSDLSSDSDVRLVLDKSLSGGASGDSDPDIKMVEPEDSDSDVKLVGDTEDEDSDSDVKLVSETPGDSGSDSDVRLVGEDTSAEDKSDSDVQLIGHGKEDPGETDSDVQLVGRPVPGSDINMIEGLRRAKESDDDTDEGVLTLSSDSSEEDIPAGLDEGRPRRPGDSGMSLVQDSGVSLESPADSGIALTDDSNIDFAGDSGISLATPGDSDVRLKSPDADQDSETIPMLKRPGQRGAAETRASVPAAEGESDFELATTGEDSGDDTSVIMFDEGDDAAETAAVIPQLTSDDDDLIDDSVFEVDELDEFAEEGEELADIDMFGDEDEFGVEPETGQSREFGGMPFGVPVAREAEWGVWTFSGLAASSVLLLVCWMLMFELVRSMWLPQQTTISNALLSVFGGFF